MRVKFGKSTKDVSILEVTPENYIVPLGEEGTFHCRIEQTQFNPRNGKRISKPFVQKFDAKMYPSISRNLKQQGWDIIVLHDPTEYLREQEEKVRQQQEMTIKQRQEAEAAKKKAERDALKEEILAELREAGMLNTGDAKEQKTTGSKK